MDFFSSPPPSLLDRAVSLASWPVNAIRSPLSTLVSLPALSVLVIPTFGSYSTSLNLLFFYLTWSTLVFSHPPLKLELYGTIAIRLLFYVLPSLCFFAFDALAPKLAIKWKEHGEDAFPLSQKRARIRQLKIFALSLFNILLGIALQGAIEYVFTEVLHIRSALKASSAIPLPWGLAKDLVQGLLLREILTYILHRYLLHSGPSFVTSLHYKYQHSISLPYSIIASYDHPLPYLIHSFIPTLLPAIAFRFHILTYLVYLSIVSLEETFVYSGYNILPSGLILGGIARRTDIHFLTEGKGNYSSGILDWVGSTSLGQDFIEDIGDEAEAHDWEGKAQQKGGKLLRKGKGIKERGKEVQAKGRGRKKSESESRSVGAKADGNRSGMRTRARKKSQEDENDEEDDV